MDEKLKKIIFIVAGVFILFILFLFLISSCKSRLTPEKLETEIVNKVESYYSLHEEELPGNNSVIVLSINDLAARGIIKELDDLLEKDTNCSGNITIENNNGYYMYSPSLSCTSPTKTYITNNLKDTLLENVVTSGSGLYNLNNEYYFRGDNVNNYIIFDGIKWRITKINSDGTIRLLEDNRRLSVVWDNRYNSDKLSETGINNFINNGLNSRMKDYLDSIYNSEDVLSNNGKGYIKPTTLCIGKRSSEETNNTGAIECSETLENEYLGLIQINEFLLGSLDPNCSKTTDIACSNYNYLAKFTNPYWSLTANNENNHQVFKISSYVSASNASNNGMARLVINISENTNVTGTGTEDDPYIVSGFDSELKKFN